MTVLDHAMSPLPGGGELDVYRPDLSTDPDVLVPLWWRPTHDGEPVCVTDEEGVTRPVICGASSVGRSTALRVAQLLAEGLEDVVPSAVLQPVTRGEWVIWLHDDERAVLTVTEKWLDRQRPGWLPSWPPR